MLYFDHSTGASTDPKIMQLRLECGVAAVDAYWYLVEQMHRDERPLCVRNANVMRVHCHTLCTDISTLENWINSMVEIGLFKVSENDGEVLSERAMENVGKFKDKQEKARSAAKAKWEGADAKQTHKRTQCKRNADAMLTKQNKTNISNAIKGITNSVSAAEAEAVKTASSASKKGDPHCPMCEVPTSFKDSLGYYHCPSCHDQFARDKVIWR